LIHTRIVDDVLAELNGRGGFDGWWGDIHPDIRTEIRQALAARVEAALTGVRIARDGARIPPAPGNARQGESESDTDPNLIQELRALGDTYGPLGVALVAAQLTDEDVLVTQIRRPRVAPLSSEE
jgi:hypothetical protein